MIMDLLTALEHVNACEPARAWLVAERKRNPGATRSIERWDACPDPGWLFWLAGRAGIDRKMIVLAACACARLVLDKVPAGEDRPRVAIETAEAWCRGEATIEQVRVARAAAWAYRWSAYAAERAAAAAAAAAADAAAADSAADSAYAAADAADAARAQMRQACADEVRRVIPWASVERGIYLAAGGALEGERR